MKELNKDKILDNLPLDRLNINIFDEIGVEPSDKLSNMKKSTNIDWNELNNSDRKSNINIKLEKIRS